MHHQCTVAALDALLIAVHLLFFQGWCNCMIPKTLSAAMDLNVSRFTNPKGSSCSATQNLYVANCGPAVGISFEDIKSVFSNFGEVVGIHVADDSGTRVIVCYSELTAAEAAFGTLNGCCCAALGGRILSMRYSIMQQAPKVLHIALSLSRIKFSYIRVLCLVLGLSALLSISCLRQV